MCLDHASPSLAFHDYFDAFKEVGLEPNSEIKLYNPISHSWTTHLIGLINLVVVNAREPILIAMPWVTQFRDLDQYTTLARRAYGLDAPNNPEPYNSEEPAWEPCRCTSLPQ